MFGITLKINQKKINIKDDESIIGRDSSSQVIIQDPSVSRRHALLTKEDMMLFIEDLGSILGTVVNGRTITKRTPLYKGDIITISSVQIEVVSGPKKDTGPPLKNIVVELEESDISSGDESTPDETKFFKGVQTTPIKKQSRLKNPFYIVLIFFTVFLLILVAIATVIPTKSKKTKGISLQNVTELTRNYLDKEPLISTEGLSNDQIKEQAKNFFDNAESKFNLMHMKYGQPYEAYTRYRKALYLLNIVKEKPEYYDRLMQHMGKCRTAIEGNIVRNMQEGWVANKQARYDDAYRSYEIVIATIPEEDFPVTGEARKQLQSIALKLPKRK